MTPEQSDADYSVRPDLKAINSVDPCDLKSRLMYRLVITVPLQLPVTTKQRENVTAIMTPAW